MLDKPRIRLNNLRTSPRFPCLGLNPIIDANNLFFFFFHYKRSFTFHKSSRFRVMGGLDFSSFMGKVHGLQKYAGNSNTIVFSDTALI